MVSADFLPTYVQFLVRDNRFGPFMDNSKNYV